MGTFATKRPANQYYIDRLDGSLNSPNGEHWEWDKRATRAGRNEYRYYVPSENHTPPGKGWEHVSESDREAVIKQHGSLETADINYIFMDYERVCSFGTDWVSYLIRAKVEAVNSSSDYLLSSGIKTSCASYWLGGIESDGGDEYHKEMAIERLQSLVHVLETEINESGDSSKDILSEMLKAVEEKIEDVKEDDGYEL